MIGFRVIGISVIAVRRGVSFHNLLSWCIIVRRSSFSHDHLSKVLHIRKPEIYGLGDRRT